MTVQNEAGNTDIKVQLVERKLTCTQTILI